MKCNVHFQFTAFISSVDYVFGQLSCNAIGFSDSNTDWLVVLSFDLPVCPACFAFFVIDDVCCKYGKADRRR